MLDSERNISCPYCGESISVILDVSVPAQEYFEDCFVCCRPILIRYRADSGEITELDANTESEV